MTIIIIYIKHNLNNSVADLEIFIRGPQTALKGGPLESCFSVIAYIMYMINEICPTKRGGGSEHPGPPLNPSLQFEIQHTPVCISGKKKYPFLTHI